MTQNQGKILAIDYGMAAIGLAVSDVGRLMAFSRGVLKDKQRGQAKELILNLIDSEQVKLVILGIPLAADGQETAQTAKIRLFGEDLRDDLESRGVVLEYVDESFSTFEANKMLKELGVKPNERKNTEDELAAVVLIHRYIDFRP
ncbi:Holliday junction resolvase RuvX [Candidatus Peregrinibacteria bacterium]|nr:Holliday junction resolvase RuvX [Candidatus Peregrinibacteria bacterium]